MIWVVDSSDRERMGDCKRELEGLLQEEVSAQKPRVTTCGGSQVWDGRC